MAEILGLGMSHYPGMRVEDNRSLLRRVLQRPDIPAEMKDPAAWPPDMVAELADDEGAAHAIQHSDAFVANCRVLRQRLDEFDPDVVVIIGDDQYENFKEDVVPTFSVLAYDEFPVRPYAPEVDLVDPEAPTSEFAPGPDLPANPWGESAETEFHYRGHRTVGKQLATGLIERGIDCAYAYRPLHVHLGHAFVNTVMFLDWDRVGFDYPIVPLVVNCYGSRVTVNRGGQYPVGSVDLPVEELDPPGPTSARCMQVGAAVAQTLRDGPWRAAIVASSSWSHAFLCPKNHFVHPDVELDLHHYEAVVDGDFDVIRKLDNPTIDESGLQEFRNWSTFLGAMEELGHAGPDYHAFLRSYLMNSSKCFAVYGSR